jgi:hypothetical protein
MFFFYSLTICFKTWEWKHKKTKKCCGLQTLRVKHLIPFRWNYLKEMLKVAFFSDKKVTWKKRKNWKPRSKIYGCFGCMKLPIICLYFILDLSKYRLKMLHNQKNFISKTSDKNSWLCSLIITPKVCEIIITISVFINLQAVITILKS